MPEYHRGPFTNMGLFQSGMDKWLHQLYSVNEIIFHS